VGPRKDPRRQLRVSARPSRLNLRITDRCELSCGICPQAARRRGEGAGRDELRVAALALYLRGRDPAAGGTAFVWGGEPLLHADLPALLALLREAGFRAELNTSGSLLAERAAELEGVDEWIVSIDGPPAIHDALRGRPGLFERVATGVERLRTRDGAARLAANLTISEGNQAHLEAAAEAIAELGCQRLVLQLPTFATAASGALHDAALAFDFGGGGHWRHFARDYRGIDPALLALSIEGALRRFPGPVTMIPYRLRGAGALRDYFADPLRVVGRKRGLCLALGGEISVEPDGALVGCPDFPDARLGSIDEAPWPHPWGTARLAALREIYLRRGLGVCARCCRFF